MNNKYLRSYYLERSQYIFTLIKKEQMSLVLKDMIIFVLYTQDKKRTNESLVLKEMIIFMLYTQTYLSLRSFPYPCVQNQNPSSVRS